MDEHSQKTKKKKSIIAAIVAVVLIGGLLGLIGLVVVGFGLIGSVSGSDLSQVDYYDENFNGINEFEASRAKRIGLLEFNGEITNGSGLGGPFASGESVITPELVRNSLDSVTKDNSELAAVVLDINSPGGEVAPADEINDLITRFAEKYPTYVYSSQLLASGAYEMAVPAKKIYTSQETLTGSIGVIGQFLNIEKLAADYGVKMETFKAGKFKDTGNPFRSPTDEEKATFQEMIDQTYDAFVADVAAGRGLEEGQVRQLATGDVWRGPQALEKGLIDGVLYKSDLIAQIKKDESIDDTVVVVEYRQPTPGLIDSLLGLSAKFSTNPVDDFAQDLIGKRSGLYYLYQGF
ncbi:signal peptide peptidase SppA [Candidatus Berkelbacteria bacterium]|nr:signal peptide peptidase SppA [Candidatus Berkelbacteria bacterium]